MVESYFDKTLDKKIDIREKSDYTFIKEIYSDDVPENFISMFVADMDFLMPKKYIEKAKEFVSKSNFGYAHLNNMFFDSIIYWYKKRKNIEISKESIKMMYGTVNALYLLNKEFLDDEHFVMFATPSYRQFENASINTSKKYIMTSLKNISNKYYFDFEDIENKMKNKKISIFILCNPHNPSGRIWTKEELTKIAELCKKYSVLLVSDEVHSDIIISGKYYSCLELDKKYQDNLIVFSSANKAFNLGGLQLSYAIIKNNELRTRMENVMKKHFVENPNIFSLFTVSTVYNECEDWFNELVEYIKQNYEILKKELKNVKNVELMEMESSYLPWLNLEKTGYDANYWVEKFSKNGLLVSSGDNFVKDAKYFVRLNLGLPRKKLEEAINIMIKCLS